MMAGGRRGMRRPLLSPPFPAPLPLGARQYGTKQARKERGESPRRMAPAVPGLGGRRSRCRCLWERRESGEDGALWLPASVCCAVSLRLSSPPPHPHGRHFKAVSAEAAPCGALPSRPARAMSLFVWEALLWRWRALSPESYKLLAPFPPFFL